MQWCMHNFLHNRVQNLMHNVVRVICRVFCRVIFLPGGQKKTPLQLCTGLLIHTLCDVALVYWELVRNLCTTYVEFFHAAFEHCAVRYRPLVVPCKIYAKLLCPCQTSTLWNDAVLRYDVCRAIMSNLTLEIANASQALALHNFHFPPLLFDFVVQNCDVSGQVVSSRRNGNKRGWALFQRT